MITDIKIELNTENDVFMGCVEYEISRILSKLANDIKEGKKPVKLKDFNGNTVGTVEYIEG